LEVLCSFHLLVSFHTDVYMVDGTHISLKRVPVNAGVTDLLESIDLSISTIVVQRMGRRRDIPGSCEAYSMPFH